MRVLYAGDSPPGGAADYLLAILRRLKAHVVHVPPNQHLRTSLFGRRYDLFLLSDFARTHMTRASEARLIRQVENGAGLLMVGGWGSFSGPFGQWKGSRVEAMLPVSCLARDDRKHFPSGAWILKRRHHPLFRALSFREPPVICGLNEIRPKKGSEVLLVARNLVGHAKEYPVLVVQEQGGIKTAAFSSDLAPHWCGGLVDWGRRRLKLRLGSPLFVEVGDRYVALVSGLLKWLAAR